MTGIAQGRAFQAVGRPTETQERERVEHRGVGRVPGMFEDWVRRPLCQEQASRAAGNAIGKQGASSYREYVAILRPLYFTLGK